MKNKSYIIVLSALVTIAVGTYQLIIPKFATKAYSRNTVENISQGLTTTTRLGAGDINQENSDESNDNSNSINENEETEAKEK